MRPLIVSTLVVLLGLPVAAYSQTAVPTGVNASATPGEIVPISDIISRVDILTSIPANTPVAIDLGSLTVPGVSSSLTNGVTVKAYTRYVEYQGRKIGQIVLSGLEKNGRVEPLPSDIYSAQFDLVDPSLDPTTDVVVKGDATRMIEALKRLDEDPEQDAAPQDAVVAQDNNAQKQDASSPTQQNDQAASYQTPDAVNVDKPVEGSYVTAENCPIRPDFASKRAIQQSKSVTTKDGVIASETECSDSFDSFPIERSYTFCTIFEDLDPAVRLATARFEYIYIDASGSRKTVIPDGQAEACALDPEKTFPIVEKPERIFLDYVNLKAVPQASLVYMDHNNREVQVRGGMASETIPAVDLIPTTSGCGIRPEFGINTSFQQGTHTYLLDGISYQAGGCSDNGTTYAHSKVFSDASGNPLCSPILDANGKPTTLLSRVSITVDGLPEYITPCAPDASAAGITATTADCDNPLTWFHDVNAGQSIGKERFFFMDGTKQIPLTGCQNSQTVYPHSYETVDWEPHDDLLYALPKKTVYITPPTGRFDVVTSQVLPGATQMPYQLTGTTERSTGLPIYLDDSCDQYIGADKFELWKRPNTSIFEKNIGDGVPSGPSYSCSGRGGDVASDWTPSTNLADQILLKTTREAADLKQRYKTTRNLVREDGKVISSTTKVSPLFWNNCYRYAVPTGYFIYDQGGLEISQVAYNKWWIRDSYVGNTIKTVSCNTNPPTSLVPSLFSAANFLY